MLKHRFISAINLFGLTVGLACCLLILTYILNETSFDKFNAKADRIYRVTRSWFGPTGDVSLNLGAVAPPFGPLLKNDFPDIEKVTVLLPNGTSTFKYGEKVFNENNGVFADQNLFDFFNVKVLRGNPAKALSDPFSVMLTPELAKKYFGNEDPINKVIRLDRQFQFKVTGIFENLPSNSHWHADHLLSFSTLKDTAVYGERNLQTNFGNNSFYTYLLLPKNYNTKSMEAQFPAFIDKVMPMDNNGKQKTSAGTALALQKLTDIHLTSHLDSEIEQNGDIKRVYIFSAIALFILLIACINYMNLSTARSALRAREIGVRKVVGAQKFELIAQFLFESVLLTWVALLLAVLLAQLAMPALDALSGQNLSLGLLLKWQVLVPLTLVPFIVGIVSGLYPALFMSSFKPILVLKGLFKVGAGNISFRKVLVVTQFSISIILIISTAIVFKQLKYMQKKNLGYDKDYVVTMGYNSSLNDSYQSFRNDLLQNPSIKEAARSSRIPSGRLLDSRGAAAPSGDSVMPVTTPIKYLAVDEDFIPAYQIKMAAGRNFSRAHANDTASFILNEAAVAALGIKNHNDIIGRPFKYGNTKGEVIGIMKDIHFESLHQKIVPLIMLHPPQPNYSRLSIKLSGQNLPATVSQIEKTWKKYLPEVPFQYTFLDESFGRLYESELKQGTIFTTFAVIAIFIACLGLFGLSAFAITQRVKEIGIRKVLGASIGSIVTLLSKDFLKLVLIAAVIAFPVAWYAMHNWLQDFAYRINIPWWVFIVAGILAATIAFITISSQAIKAAVSNPVKSLRSE
ncbi:ABC transporter permease [Segetibacter aerophilus]|uniref:ABC transporter permease n=1 Tax=Segetibacter aerophilus TaxID=670293 RepID=UPI001FED0DF1|nr:ABC transporter permease [Segetibacter aerophilus]